MNRFTEKLLVANWPSPIHCTGAVLGIYGLFTVYDQHLPYVGNYNSYTEDKYTFIAFLATMSDEDIDLYIAEWKES